MVLHGRVRESADVTRGRHLERMVRALAGRRADVALCGTCMNARGIREDQLVDGARRSTMDELADSTLWADKVVTF